MNTTRRQVEVDTLLQKRLPDLAKDAVRAQETRKVATELRRLEAETRRQSAINAARIRMNRGLDQAIALKTRAIDMNATRRAAANVEARAQKVATMRQDIAGLSKIYYDRLVASRLTGLRSNILSQIEINRTTYNNRIRTLRNRLVGRLGISVRNVATIDVSSAANRYGQATAKLNSTNTIVNGKNTDLRETAKDINAILQDSVYSIYTRERAAIVNIKSNLDSARATRNRIGLEVDENSSRLNQARATFESNSNNLFSAQRTIVNLRQLPDALGPVQRDLATVLRPEELNAASIQALKDATQARKAALDAEEGSLAALRDSDFYGKQEVAARERAQTLADSKPTDIQGRIEAMRENLDTAIESTRVDLESAGKALESAEAYLSKREADLETTKADLSRKKGEIARKDGEVTAARLQEGEDSVRMMADTTNVNIFAANLDVLGSKIGPRSEAARSAVDAVEVAAPVRDVRFGEVTTRLAENGIEIANANKTLDYATEVRDALLETVDTSLLPLRSTIDGQLPGLRDRVTASRGGLDQLILDKDATLSRKGGLEATRTGIMTLRNNTFIRYRTGLSRRDTSLFVYDSRRRLLGAPDRVAAEDVLGRLERTSAYDLLLGGIRATSMQRMGSKGSTFGSKLRKLETTQGVTQKKNADLENNLESIQTTQRDIANLDSSRLREVGLSQTIEGELRAARADLRRIEGERDTTNTRINSTETNISRGTNGLRSELTGLEGILKEGTGLRPQLTTLEVIRSSIDLGYSKTEGRIAEAAAGKARSEADTAEGQRVSAEALAANAGLRETAADAARVELEGEKSRAIKTNADAISTLQTNTDGGLQLAQRALTEAGAARTEATSTRERLETDMAGVKEQLASNAADQATKAAEIGTARGAEADAASKRDTDAGARDGIEAQLGILGSRLPGAEATVTSTREAAEAAAPIADPAVPGKRARVADIPGEVEAANGRLEKATGSKQDLADSLQSLSNQRGSLNTTLDGVRGGRVSLDLAVPDLLGKKTTQEGIRDDTNRARTTLVQRIGAVFSRFRTFAIRVGASLAIYRGRARIVEVVPKVEAERIELGTTERAAVYDTFLGGQRTTATASMRASAGKFSAALSRLNSSTQALPTKNADLTTLKGTIDSNLMAVDDLASNRDLEQRELSRIDQDIGDAVAVRSAKGGELNTTSQLIRGVQRQIELGARRLRDAVGDIQRLASSGVGLRGDLRAAEAIRAANEPTPLKRAGAEAERAAGVARTEAADAETLRAGAEGVASRAEAEITGATGRIGDLETTKAGARASVDSSLKTIADNVDANLTSLDTSIKGGLGAGVVFRKQIADLEVDLADVKQQLGSNSADQVTKAAEIGTARGAEADAASKRDADAGARDGIERQLGILGSRLPGAEAMVTSTRGAAEAAVPVADPAVPGKGARMADIPGEVDAANGRLENTRQTLAGLTGLLMARRADATSLKLELDTTRNDVGGLKDTGIPRLLAKKAGLEATLKGLEPVRADIGLRLDSTWGRFRERATTAGIALAIFQGRQRLAEVPLLGVKDVETVEAGRGARLAAYDLMILGMRGLSSKGIEGAAARYAEVQGRRGGTETQRTNAKKELATVTRDIGLRLEDQADLDAAILAKQATLDDLKGLLADAGTAKTRAEAEAMVAATSVKGEAAALARNLDGLGDTAALLRDSTLEGVQLRGGLTSLRADLGRIDVESLRSSGENAGTGARAVRADALAADMARLRAEETAARADTEILGAEGRTKSLEQDKVAGQQAFRESLQAIEGNIDGSILKLGNEIKGAVGARAEASKVLGGLRTDLADVEGAIGDVQGRLDRTGRDLAAARGDESAARDQRNRDALVVEAVKGGLSRLGAEVPGKLADLAGGEPIRPLADPSVPGKVDDLDMAGDRIVELGLTRTEAEGEVFLLRRVLSDLKTKADATGTDLSRTLEEVGAILKGIDQLEGTRGGIRAGDRQRLADSSRVKGDIRASQQRFRSLFLRASAAETIILARQKLLREGEPGGRVLNDLELLGMKRRTEGLDNVNNYVRNLAAQKIGVAAQRTGLQRRVMDDIGQRRATSIEKLGSVTKAIGDANVLRADLETGLVREGGLLGNLDADIKSGINDINAIGKGATRINADISTMDAEVSRGLRGLNGEIQRLGDLNAARGLLTKDLADVGLSREGVDPEAVRLAAQRAADGSMRARADAMNAEGKRLDAQNRGEDAAGRERAAADAIEGLQGQKGQAKELNAANLDQLATRTDGDMGQIQGKLDGAMEDMEGQVENKNRLNEDKSKVNSLLKALRASIPPKESALDSARYRERVDRDAADRNTRAKDDIQKRLDEEIDTLNKEIDTQQNDYDNTNREILDTEAQIKDLENRKDAMNPEDFDAEMSLLREKLKTLQMKLEVVRGLVAKLQRLRLAEEAMANARKDLEDMDLNIKRKKEKLDELDTKLENKEIDLETYNRQKKLLKAELDALNARRKALEAEIQRLRDEIDALRRDIDALKRKKAELDAELQRLRAALADLAVKRNKTSDMLNKLLGMLNSLLGLILNVFLPMLLPKPIEEVPYGEGAAAYGEAAYGDAAYGEAGYGEAGYGEGSTAGPVNTGMQGVLAKINAARAAVLPGGMFGFPSAAAAAAAAAASSEFDRALTVAETPLTDYEKGVRDGRQRAKIDAFKQGIEEGETETLRIFGLTSKSLMSERELLDAMRRLESEYAARFRQLQKEVYATTKDEFCARVIEKLEAEGLPVAEVYPDCLAPGPTGAQAGGAEVATSLSEDYVRGYQAAYDMTYPVYFAQGNVLGKQRALGILYEAPQVLQKMQDIAAAATVVGGSITKLLARAAGGRRLPSSSRNKTLTQARALLDKIKERTKIAGTSKK